MANAAPTFRDTPAPGDAEAVRALVAKTAFFRPAEIDIAVELAEDWIRRGAEASGYFHALADGPGGALLGYACWGPVPGTASGVDLYWLVVDPDGQRQGLGRRLLAEAEARAAEAGGETIYAETSGMELYAPTRAFYLRCGFEEVARLKDYYLRGDDKVIYAKSIARRP